MYPDDPNQKPQEYPVDYLNQIATTTPKRGFEPNLKWLVILLGAVAVIVLVFVIIMSLGGQSNVNQRLAARLDQTVKISQDAQKNIKSSHLRSLNGSLAIILTNTNRDLKTSLSSEGVDPGKLPARVTTAEQQEVGELSAKLEDARLNATYDRTYAREMAYRLETINTHLKTAYDSSSNPEYKQFLTESAESIGPLYEQIAKFNEDGR